MALRSGHGAGAGVPRIEVLPVDELPAGTPEHAGPPAADERGADGRFRAGNRISAKGGRRKAGALALSRRLGLSADQHEAFAPYYRQAEQWRRHKVNELARTVGGGYCGAGPSSIIATAARQLASSLYLFDLAAATGDKDLHTTASKLGNDSRQNLLAAHELASKEADVRSGGMSDIERLTAEIMAVKALKERTK
jgi:hypothetical protein